MFKNPFSDTELSLRVSAVRAEMDARDLDLIVLAQPECPFYLAGLDHRGYFAPTYLIVLAEGDLVLVTRVMEWITIGNQLRNARFAGHDDSEPAPFGLARERVMLEVSGCVSRYRAPLGRLVHLGSIREGMTFHQLNWFFDAWRGDFVAANSIMLGRDGPERLTHTPINPTVL